MQTLRHKTQCLLALAVFCVLTVYARRSAAEERIVISVGSNTGLVDEDALRFGRKDAQDFAQVMSKLGNVKPHNVHLLLEPTKEQLYEKIGPVLQGLGRDATLLFYFSGHGSEHFLHLAGQSVARSRLRELLQGSSARLKISIVDSCRGSKERSIQLGNSFELLDPKIYSGLIELQSTSRGESAFESRRMQGGRFTRHLLSGLRGAADLDQNGKVNLNEAYVFAYERTLADSASTQTPSRSFLDLGGSGLIDMTTVIETDARLVLQPETSARYTIYRTTEGGGTVFAEAWTNPKHATTIALPTGEFLIWRTVAGSPKVGLAEIAIDRNGTQQLRAADFQGVSLSDMQRRGGIDYAHDVEVVSNYLAKRQHHPIELGVGYRLAPRRRTAVGIGPSATLNYSLEANRQVSSLSLGLSIARERSVLETHSVRRDSIEGFVGVRVPGFNWDTFALSTRIGAIATYTREEKALRTATAVERSGFDSYGGLLQVGLGAPLTGQLGWKFGVELRVQSFAERQQSGGLLPSDSSIRVATSIAILTGVSFGS